MRHITIHHIIQTSIVTAFTLASALIWRDFLIAVMNKFVSPERELLFQLIAAIVSTLFVIIGIYIVLKTEDEAEYLITYIKKKKKLK